MQRNDSSVERREDDSERKHSQRRRDRWRRLQAKERGRRCLAKVVQGMSQAFGSVTIIRGDLWPVTIELGEDNSMAVTCMIPKVFRHCN